MSGLRWEPPEERDSRVAALERELAMLREETAREIDQLRAELHRARRLEDALFESVDIGVVHLDRNANFLRVNRLYASFDQKEPDFFPGKNHFELYPNIDNQEIFRRVVAGETVSMEAKPFFFAEHPERGVTYWNWRMQPLRNELGEVESVLFTLHDVSEHRQLHLLQKIDEGHEAEALRVQEVLDSLEERIAVFSRDGRPLSLNRAYLEKLGVSRSDQALGEVDAYEVYALDGKPLPREQWPLFRLLRGETFRNVEILVQHIARGEREYLSYNGHPVFKDGRWVFSVVTCRSVSALKEAQLALAQSERLFRTAVDNYPFSFVIFDAERRIRYANPYLVRASGLPREEIIGHRDEEFFPDEATRTYVPLIEKAIETRTIQSDTISFPLNGSRRYLYVNYVPVLDESGRLEHVLGITYNLNPVMEAREALESANARLLRQAEELRQTVSDLESFAYSLAHDLSAPLRGIVGFSQILEEEFAPQLGEAGRGLLERVVNNGKRMSVLLDDMLRLARVARAPYQAQVLDLVPLVREVVNQICDDNRRQYNLLVPEQLVVEGDRGLLRVALSNLLHNAVKFARPGKENVVELGALGPDAQGRLVCFIRDNGIGFDMQESSRLFTPFGRLSSAGEIPGNGIGLAIVKRVIERHGGRIWAESLPGEGATFFFSLRSG